MICQQANSPVNAQVAAVCVGACTSACITVHLSVSDVEENKQRSCKTGEGRREGASLFKTKFLVYLFD